MTDEDEELLKKGIPVVAPPEEHIVEDAEDPDDEPQLPEESPPVEHDWSVLRPEFEDHEIETPEIEHTWFENWSVIPDGLISEFFSLVTTDSPDIFKLLSIYNTISSMLGPYFSYGKYRLNLMSILSSPPGIGRRSTVMRYDEKLRLEALKTFCTHLGMSGKNAQSLHNCLSIMTGTPEGIADDIVFASTDKIFLATEPHFFIIEDSEFGQTLKQYGFQYGILTLVSRLKYGEYFKFAHSKRTKKEEESTPRIIPNNTYATLLGGMQDPSMFIDYTHIFQGFFRRLVFAYVEPKDITKWIPPLQYAKTNMVEEEKLKALGKKIGELKFKYRGMYLKNRPIEITFENSNLETIINNISKESYELKSNDAVALSKQNDWEHVFILACLNAISRDSITNGKLVVKTIDVFLAKAIIIRLSLNRDMFCRNACISEENVQVAMNTLKAFIKQKGVVETSELLNTFGVTVEYLMKLIYTLKSSGVVSFDNNIVTWLNKVKR